MSCARRLLIFAACFFVTYAFILPSNGIPLFQFGDSLSDTGNKIIAFPDDSNSKLFVKPPYGMTFFNHPANRISDGRLIIDFLATRFGLPFLNPYLSNQSFTNGVNFAVAGATAVSLETYKARNLLVANTFALDTQLNWFLQFRKHALESKAFPLSMFEDALYVVGEIGGNDYGRVWIAGWSFEEIQSFVEPVVDSVRKHTRSLYEAGARRFLVVNLPLQGCAPRNLAMALPDDEYDELGCLVKMKKIGVLHNVALKALVEELKQDLCDASFAYADFYSVMVDVMRNIRNYGFKDDRKACCGIFTKTLFLDCGASMIVNGVEFNGTACQNPSQFLFWNDNHFTEHFYEIAANSFFAQLKFMDKIQYYK